MLLRFFKVESVVIEMIMIEFSVPDHNETIIKNIFKHWTSWSCVTYAMVHWSVLQWTRGERVPLSLYFISILWLHSTDDRKGDGLFLFQTITGAHIRFFFLLLQRFSSLFFLLLVYGRAFPHFFTAQQVTKAAVFNVRVR